MKSIKNFLPFLLTLNVLLITTIAYGQLSPNSNDVIIPRYDALRVLAAADSGRIYMQLNAELLTRIDSLKKQLVIKDNRIKSYATQTTGYQKLITNYKQTEKAALMSIASLNKDLRKQKRATRWTAIGGLAAVVATIFLLK